MLVTLAYKGSSVVSRDAPAVSSCRSLPTPCHDCGGNPLLEVIEITVTDYEEGVRYLGQRDARPVVPAQAVPQLPDAWQGDLVREGATAGSTGRRLASRFRNCRGLGGAASRRIAYSR
jgi:hypothetical protein